MPDTLTDQRLLRAREDLAAGRIRVLSVDVFDTLVWRRVPEPADLFLVLGQELAAAGALAPHMTPVAFAELRRAAERAAREKVEAVTGYREVTLPDIYAALPESLFAATFNRSAQVAAELACERRLLVADGDILALMAAAKAAGAKVILVSDTYFKSDELQALLLAAGCADLGLVDRLYVSCEAGKPKYRDLFDTVIADLGAAPDQILHVGDSPEADIMPATARKITTLHYDKWAFSGRVRVHEFPKAAAERAEILGTRGDFGLTGLRARLWHRAPAALPQDLKPYWRIGASELAPVFTGFARWAAGSCAAAGHAKVFGLMREGRFLGRLVGKVAAGLGVTLAVEELWLSRRAVIGAALYPDDLALLGDVIAVAPGETMGDVLANIGVDLADITAVLPGFDMRAPGALAVLTQTIAATPALKDKVLARSAAARANLLKGLARQIDLGKPQTIALMDLGYAATIQTVLAGILVRENIPLRLEGFYFALNDKALVNRQKGGALHAFIAGDGFNGTTARLLSRTPDVLEHACMCRDGSLSHYDDRGMPVLLPNQRDEAQLTQMEALQDGILAGMAAINRLLGDLSVTPQHEPGLARQAACMVESMLLYPSKEEVDTIGLWQHEANFDLTDRRRLVDLGFDPGALEYRGFAALADVGRQNAYWPAAAFARTSPFLGAAYAAGVKGAFGPEFLTSGPLLGGLTITPDLGAGFDPRRGGTVAMPVNAFGRGEVRITIKGLGPEAFTRVKLTWPESQAVIALLPPVFLCRGEQEARALSLRGLAWTGTRDISQGVQLTTGVAETIVELADPPPFAHALEMTLRFKYLRLSPIFGAR